MYYSIVSVDFLESDFSPTETPVRRYMSVNRKTALSPEHDASNQGDYMVFRIYTFVMRMSHNLTKYRKIF
mgnify:CR=1 FL=1